MNVRRWSRWNSQNIHRTGKTVTGLCFGLQATASQLILLGLGALANVILRNSPPSCPRTSTPLSKYIAPTMDGFQIVEG